MGRKISSTGRKSAQKNAQSTCEYAAPNFLECTWGTFYRGAVSSQQNETASHVVALWEFPESKRQVPECRGPPNGSRCSARGILGNRENRARAGPSSGLPFQGRRTSVPVRVRCRVPSLAGRSGGPGSYPHQAGCSSPSRPAGARPHLSTALPDVPRGEGFPDKSKKNQPTSLPGATSDLEKPRTRVSPSSSSGGRTPGLP